MMVLLIQCALGAVLLLSSYVVVGLLHGSWLMVGIVGFALIGVLWFAYLVWQSQHPNWWAPWDMGLPQTTRMSNAFIPVLIVFVFVLMLAPVAQAGEAKKPGAASACFAKNRDKKTTSRRKIGGGAAVK